METVEGTRLHYGDFIVIVAYFAFVLFIGLWVCIKIFFFLFKNFLCSPGGHDPKVHVLIIEMSIIECLFNQQNLFFKENLKFLQFL